MILYTPMPHVNFFSGTGMDQLWNYIKGMLYMGMPIFLIMVAIFFVGFLFEMIVDVVKKSKEEKTEDYENW